MSTFQGDLMTALASVASGQVYPQAAPADAAIPFVVYRILGKETIQTINGDVHQTNYTVAFDSWAGDYSSAVTLSNSVAAAIEASDLVSYRENSPGEEYEPQVDMYVEPVYYGFWY